MAFDRLIQLTLRARNFLSKDVEPATDSMRELAEEGRQLKASLEEVGRARGLARTLRDNQQATEALERAQRDAQATLDDLTREVGDHAQATAGQRIALREARRTMDEAERAYKRNQQAIKNTTSELKKLGVDTDNAAAEEQRLTNELAEGKKALATNREAIKQKRVEEKKAAEIAKEHADRVDAARSALSDGAKRVLAFAAAYVSLNAVFGLVQRGLNLVSTGIRAVITDGSEKEQALAQLEAALVSTGNAAGFTAKQLLEMADGLEKSSMLTAEQVQAAQTRLLSYTDVVGEQFPKAMQIVIDQQQRLGISAEQSAEIVGRALQSPVEAMTTLGRQGFKLEDGQKRLLKQLVATGKTAEAQAVIMDMMTEAYGGSAAAARMNTAAGLWKGLTDRFGDFASRVSQSGAFDFVKRKLVEVAEAIEQMDQDGRLDALAESLSNAFIQGAEKVEAFARQLLDVDFKRLIDDSAAWLNQFGSNIDKTVAALQLISAPIRIASNLLTGFMAAAGTAFTALAGTSLAVIGTIAKAIPNALGGEALVAGIESARDKVFGLMKGLANQVGQDGRDIANTWEGVASSAESSADRQVAAAKRAADETRSVLQQNGDDIAAFFRANISSLEQAMAAISFAETAADLEEVATGLQNSKLATDEMTTAMAALEQKRGFVTIGADAKRTSTELEQLRAKQARLRDEYLAGTVTLEHWQQGHNAAAEAIRKLDGETSKTAVSVKAFGDSLKSLADIQNAISGAKTVVDIRNVNAALNKLYNDGVITAAEYNAELKKAAARQRELKSAIDHGADAQTKRNAADKEAIKTSADLRAESGKRMEAERRAGDQAMQDRRRGSEEAKRDMGAMEDFFGGVMSRAREPLAALSGAALEAFDRLNNISTANVQMDTSSLDATTSSLKRATEALGEMHAAANTVGMSEIGQWMTRTALQSQQLQIQFLGQKARLQSLMEGYEDGSITVQQFVKRASSARHAMGLLNDSDLRTLEGAIQAAKDRMEQMANSTRSTLEGLQDELDNLQGRTEDVERRRFDSRRRELQAQLAEANAQGDSQAVANAARALGMLRQIESESAQQRQREEQQKRIDAQRQPQGAAPQQAQAQSPNKVIRLEVPGRRPVDVAVNSDADETNLLGILESAGLRAL